MKQVGARQRLNDSHYLRRITGESFAGADLTSLRLNQLWFVRCSFTGADLRLGTLDHCSFAFCDLTDANLRGSSLRFARFVACDLRDADLRDTDLTGASFGYVNTGTDHGRTDVTGALFAGATITEVSVERVLGWPEV